MRLNEEKQSVHFIFIAAHISIGSQERMVELQLGYCRTLVSSDDRELNSALEVDYVSNLSTAQ